ncbi:MAG: hypothetical protein NT003_02525 [Candidatus Magasanikbacteria bacterium]|nr:hypothetical protein [Candidatus Magasanikbacteria bacterium]
MALTLTEDQAQMVARAIFRGFVDRNANALSMEQLFAAALKYLSIRTNAQDLEESAKKLGFIFPMEQPAGHFCMGPRLYLGLSGPDLALHTRMTAKRTPRLQPKSATSAGDPRLPEPKVKMHVVAPGAVSVAAGINGRHSLFQKPTIDPNAFKMDGVCYGPRRNSAPHSDSMKIVAELVRQLHRAFDMDQARRTFVGPENIFLTDVALEEFLVRREQSGWLHVVRNGKDIIVCEWLIQNMEFFVAQPPEVSPVA